MPLLFIYGIPFITSTSLYYGTPGKIKTKGVFKRCKTCIGPASCSEMYSTGGASNSKPTSDREGDRNANRHTDILTDSEFNIDQQIICFSDAANVSIKWICLHASVVGSIKMTITCYNIVDDLCQLWERFSVSLSLRSSIMTLYKKKVCCVMNNM